MITTLESWLQQATRHLAKDSAGQVRKEIQEHFESACAAAVDRGSTIAEAETFALNALGHARTANRQYKRVLLTSAEAKLLRDGNWEAAAICSRPWMKWLATAAPVVGVMAAMVFFLNGRVAVSRDVLIASLGMSPLLAALLLPINTISRGRVFRFFKWIAIIGALLLLFGPAAFKWSWLLISCLWPLVWTEWRRTSIRRKLPILTWPKHLYL